MNVRHRSTSPRGLRHARTIGLFEKLLHDQRTDAVIFNVQQANHPETIFQSWAGSSIRKTDPLSFLLSTSMRPPNNSVYRRAMANPNPEPSKRRF